MRRMHGFTYLGVLLLVAATSAAAASLGHRWSMAAQRERDRELQARGREIATAIAAYVRARGFDVATAPSEALPRHLEDLLVDERGTVKHHHLRRLYADPFTGRPDWLLLARAGSLQDGFVGVASRAAMRSMSGATAADGGAGGSRAVFRAPGLPNDLGLIPIQRQ